MSDKGRFGFIANSRELTGTPENSRERTGAHMSVQERTVKTNNFQQIPSQTPDKQTNKY